MKEKLIKKKKVIKSKNLPRDNKSISSNVNEYQYEVEKLKKTISVWDDLLLPECDEETRGCAWVRLDVLGSSLCDKYAWAIPNERALIIISYFSPIIEIGCGKGYWVKLLLDRGVDIVAYDKYTDVKDSTNWLQNILKGSPKVLNKSEYKQRTLLLSYPDEAESMSIKCLEYFQGDHIIHIGEMITTGGTLSGQPQIPFGRTTSSEFQIALLENFHCLLVAEIPQYPFSKDTISVWKRTSFIQGRESDEDEGMNLWAAIPKEEKLPVTRAAPCLQHLLL